MKLFLESAMER